MKQFLKNSWEKLVLIFSVVDWRDVAVRALKTLVQAFIASVGLSIASGHALDTVLTSALAAAVSALWNGVLSPVWKAIGDKADEVIVAPETEHVSTTDGGMVQVDVAAVKGATVAEINAALNQAKKDATKAINRG
jgi:hypothetical protein